MTQQQLLDWAAEYKTLMLQREAEKPPETREAPALELLRAVNGLVEYLIAKDTCDG